MCLDPYIVRGRTIDIRREGRTKYVNKQVGLTVSCQIDIMENE